MRVGSLDDLTYTNRFSAQLPADPELDNRPRQVNGAAFSRVTPTAVSAPSLVAFSPEVAELLGLDPAALADPATMAALAGNRVPIGADPFAMAYGGHQFGNWAGQLGDGRAIVLGEVTDARGGHQTLQLKGAGPTPYSRSADGRAVLRSSIREFLCSEAVHHLGIPTTRALSVVRTGDAVVRDVLYDGNAAPEPGAVVCRVAPSFTRFGNFQLPAARGDGALLEALVRFTVAADFGHLADAETAANEPLDRLVPRWFADVVERTAALMVDWMRVGFVHGVMNTDNLSILGLTIDYGPYGWLEGFDPGWTPNTTDASMRRYRYGTQPQVANWDLLQLANALVPLIGDPEPLQAALDTYGERYQSGYQATLAGRLGWGAWADGDAALADELFALLVRAEIDQVLWFRDLVDVPVSPDADDDELLTPLADAYYSPDEVDDDLRAGTAAWLRAWGNRVRADGTDEEERRQVMDSLNPLFVLRNYLAQEAIEASEQGDDSLVQELLDVLRHPYDDQPGRERFAAKRPEWARHKVGASMLSCSS